MIIEKNIINLAKYTGSLKGESKELFNRFFSTHISTGMIQPQKDMIPWIRKQFGSLAAVKKQRVVRVTNKITFEGALFNELRTKRPEVQNNSEETTNSINKSSGGNFCRPKNSTPMDIFGRVKGKKSISSANVALYDVPHSLIIFDKHNPLKITKEEFYDHFMTAKKWFSKAHKNYPDSKYPFLMWNCLWKSGSSIVHGHFQTMLASHEHYGKIEFYNEISKVYDDMYGRDYWEDIWKAHKSIGLGKKKNGIKMFVSITPIKEKEIIVIADRYDKNFIDACYHVVHTYIKRLDVKSFNMGVYLPPLGDSRNDWSLPIIARFVDRGSLTSKTADVGAMELLAGHSVIGSDPYKVFDKL